MIALDPSSVQLEPAASEDRDRATIAHCARILRCLVEFPDGEQRWYRLEVEEAPHDESRHEKMLDYARMLSERMKEADR